jgi:hypothetical protein
VECTFGLLAGPRHDRFVVFPGEQVKDDIGNRRVARAKHRFCISGAVLKFQPHNDRSCSLRQRFGYLTKVSLGKSKGCEDCTAKSEELPSGNTVTF